MRHEERDHAVFASKVFGYKSDKELVDACVKDFLGAADSMLSQARGDATGLDGISPNEAAQQARVAWSAMQRARLFVVEPERYTTLYTASDRYVESLAGLDWEAFDPQKKVPIEALDKHLAVYEEHGIHWPFPNPLPFDSCFFAYGSKLDLRRFSEVALYTRIREKEWRHVGCPPVYLVGHLLAWEGDVSMAFTVLKMGDSTRPAPVQVNAGHYALVRAYEDDEWCQPMSLDPWVLSMLVRSVNEHKNIIQEYAPTLSNRLDRKQASKSSKKLLPLPAPFYKVNLKDEFISPPYKKGKGGGRPVEWSHRWDVRGHEVCRILRGELPVPEREFRRLKNRGYRIYEGMSLSGEDAARLLKRGVRAPGPREWCAILSYWREASVRGPKDRPYVPGARTGA